MKKGTKIGLIIAGLAGVGILIWSKISQVKTFAKSLVVTPMWYGGINDMQISMEGVKCPLAVDFGNRSDLSLSVKLNSFDVVNGKGSVIARNSSSGTDPIEIPANGTGRMPVDVWIPITTLSQLISSAVTSIIAGDTSSIANKCKELIAGCTMRFGITINNTINASFSVVLDQEAEVKIDENSVKGLGLVCAQDRKIGSIEDYRQFLPSIDKLCHNDRDIIDDVQPEQTAQMIRKMAVRYKKDTQMLSYALERDTIEDTIQAIWDFVASYIKYTEDRSDCEELRRPLRTLYEQKGDCDCYSLLIASICENLGLRYDIRIAEYYNRGYFQHVYIVIEGFVCDPVIDKCFKEKKPTKQKDF